MVSDYQKPGWFVTKIVNPAFQFLIGRVGVSPAGAQVLTVKGRNSGKPHSVPVNPITHNGNRFLVAPRGNTQWVRNLRAAGEATLRVGSRSEPMLSRELPDGDKPEVLRVYLDKYYGQVGSQFDVAKDASPEDLARIAPSHPVFHIHNKEIV